MRRVLFLLLAVVIAGGTAVFARAWLENREQAIRAAAAPPPVSAPDFIEVLVAAERLVPGSFVKPSSLRWQKWPDVELPSTYLVKGTVEPQAFEGAVVRQLLSPGDPLLASAVILPGDRGFLAAVLDPGMRAVSVPVDDASSNSGLIFPGDRVDLILTQSVAGGAEDGAGRRVSETVLENVRVIAMGRRLHTDSNDEIGSTQIRTTTLEVTPQGAEVVALMTELGKLSLSLRSIAAVPAGDAEAHEPGHRLTWDSDVSRALGGSDGRPRSLTIIRGAQTQHLQLRDGSVE